MLAYLKFELRRMYREPRLIILTVAMPVILFLALGGSIKGDTPEKTKEILAYLMVAWAAYGALLGTFSSGVGVSHERSAGWLRQLRITPLPPATVVITKAIACSLVAIPAVLVVSVIGMARNVDFSVGQLALLVLLMWLGSVPFALVGLAVGFVLPPNLAQPASFLVSFGLAFAGGIFIQSDDMPKTMQQIVEWSPSYRFTQAGYAVLQHDTQSGTGWAIIAGWALVFAALAALAYRRSAAAK
ncbi:MAG: ABC transporter permease [Hamadaea sp.]|uniref:ABC transporter permease n=1 Tax=Hamadaea sp. TaxID=2024425 RepID=UPI0017933882|nr:ABC transporter permease [Hamadaea sp.]NUR71197.1 ABC transporter permease [Hamadaea sp.]NUT17728.1 ABC transporter permease [Hamadaea sp.]